jgi:hypothetical protein
MQSTESASVFKNMLQGYRARRIASPLRLLRTRRSAKAAGASPERSFIKIPIEMRIGTRPT